MPISMPDPQKVNENSLFFILGKLMICGLKKIRLKF